MIRCFLAPHTESFLFKASVQHEFNQVLQRSDTDKVYSVQLVCRLRKSLFLRMLLMRSFAYKEKLKLIV